MSNSNNDPMALEELSLNDLHFDDNDHRDPKPDNQQNESILARLKSIVSISEMLRIFGACAVILSMSLFMLKDWGTHNDVQRYLMLLGQTGLLTVAGLASSIILKEFKGARVFLALALISVVTNFTILGSLLYSLFQFDDGLLHAYPTMVTWKVDSLGLFLPVFSFAMVALPILTWFGMSIFARRIAAPLTFGFLALNCLLLIPMRSSTAIFALVAFALIVAGYLAKRLSRTQDLIITHETKFALGSLFIPGLILVARSLSLYANELVLSITLSGLAYFALRSVVVHATQTSFYKRVIEITQYGLGVGIALQIIALLPYQLDVLYIGIFSSIVVAFAADQIVRSTNKKWSSSILNFTVIGLVLFNTLEAFGSPSFDIQLLSLATCGALFLLVPTSTSYVYNISTSRRAAIIGALAIFAHITIKFISLLNLGNWIVIGLIGILLIIIASLYERFGLKFSVNK